MVTPSMTTQYETNRYESRRTPSIFLPEDPSQEELAQYWTLSAQDRTEVLRCRGDANGSDKAQSTKGLGKFGVQLATSPPQTQSDQRPAGPK